MYKYRVKNFGAEVDEIVEASFVRLRDGSVEFYRQGREHDTPRAGPDDIVPEGYGAPDILVLALPYYDEIRIIEQ